MPLTKTVRGVLIQKTKREWQTDRGELVSGFFCQIVTDAAETEVLQFWAPVKFMDDMGPEHSIEGYVASKAKTWTMSVRQWGDTEKRTLLGVK